MFYVPDRDTVVWATATAPNGIHELPGFREFKSISHWVPGTGWITYVQAVAGSTSPQLVYLDTETGAVHQVSDEPGDKFDGWGFRAPEFGGEILMMCVIDRREIAIYRDLARNGQPWARIATLRLPADAPHTHIYSVEPIAPGTGVDGTSWFSLNAMAGGTGAQPRRDRSHSQGRFHLGAEPGLGTDPVTRLARRIDEGAISGIATARYEAESMAGAEEVFIYYERRNPETARGELRRCRTGIRAHPTAEGAPTPQADQGFVPDAPFVGEVSGSYIDPEFSESASQVVFQDAQNRIWIGDIDPATGRFRTATGRDYLMDENITLIFDRPPQGRKFSTR